MSAADQVISVAMAQRGKPYVFGAAGPNTFDCSGLVVYAYKNGAGISLPHFTGSLWTKGTHVSKANLAPGDLVFPNPSHVGIFIGNGNMVVAPHTGTVVQVQAVSTVWGATRIIDPGSAIGSDGVSTTNVGLDVPGLAETQALFGIATQFNDIVKKFTDPKLWIRIGLTIAGFFLILFGLVKWEHVKAIATRIKKVGSGGAQ